MLSQGKIQRKKHDAPELQVQLHPAALPAAPLVSPAVQQPDALSHDDLVHEHSPSSGETGHAFGDLRMFAETPLAGQVQRLSHPGNPDTPPDADTAGMPASSVQTLPLSRPTPAFDQAGPTVQLAAPRRVQRACACGGTAESEDECAACRQQRMDSPAVVGLQAKLRIPLATAETQMVQQQTAEEAEATPVMMTASSDQMPDRTSDVESYLKASSGGGEPLSEADRAFAEPRFGYDFSGVRVHTDAQAGRAAQSLNALAFTTGQDIYFGQGAYEPASARGQRLLAHELTHVVQQNNHIQGRLVQTKPDDEHPFGIRVRFPFKELGILSDSTGRQFHVAFLEYYHNVSTRRANEMVDAMLRRNPERYTWNITEQQREQGFLIVFLEVSAREFIETHLADDDMGEARLPGGKREGYETRKENFDQLPARVKRRITQETDRRYWESTGLQGERIKRGEKGKAQVWLDIRDKVIAEHEFLANLPARVKRFMTFKTGSEELKARDYEKLMDIAKLVLSMSEEEVNEYLSRDLKPTRDLDEFEQSIRAFLEGQEPGGGKGDEPGGGKGDEPGGGKGDEPGGGKGDEPGKKSGSKYGRYGLINMPQPVIDVLEKAAEILGDPEEMTDLVALIEELIALNDISTDITNIFKDPDNILLLALGLIDNPAIESVDTWVFKPAKKSTKKSSGRAKGIKRILNKVKRLIPLIKKVLKPVFLARRRAMGIQFEALLLIDKMPAGLIEKIIELAKGGDDASLSAELEKVAQNVSTQIAEELNALPELLNTLEKPGDIKLIDKEDLGEVVAKAVIKLAGGVYGKAASKIGADDAIADIAKHGTKYTIPDELVDGINSNLTAIFEEFMPLIEQASGTVEEVLTGIDMVISKMLIPGLESVVSPKASDATGARLRGTGVSFLDSVSRSRGQRLPEDLGMAMEHQFGHDFQNVSIHTDSYADKASAQINADAFTMRDNIYFRNQLYDPQSESGLHLMTHELAHVVQHNRDNISDLISRATTPQALRNRLAQKLVGRVLRGTGKTKRSIRGRRFIDYGYIDSAGRPGGIVARIKKSLLDKGTKANPRIRPPGFKSGAHGHARCHLLGNQLGGSGYDKRNLVTCFQDVNNTSMKTIENKVYEAVSKGETILYKVIPLYRPKGKIPYAIRITAKGDGSPATDIDEILTNRR